MCPSLQKPQRWRRKPRPRPEVRHRSLNPSNAKSAPGHSRGQELPQGYAAPIGLLAAALLAGCCPRPQLTLPPLNREIAERCTPVGALLSKNYHRKRAADLLILSGGEEVDKIGAILSGEEAERIHQLDTLCRAWVMKAISDDQYGDALLDFASAAILRTTTPEQRQAAADETKKDLARMREKGIVPPSADPASLAAHIDKDALLTPAELDVRLDAKFANVATKFDDFFSLSSGFQAEIRTRLGSIEARLASTPNSPPNPGAARGEAMDIYFSTGSAELTYDARARLRAAAPGWLRDKARLALVGYADPRGGRVTNARLSLARAGAVAAELVRLSIPVCEVRGGGAGASIGDFDSMRVVRVQVAC